MRGCGERGFAPVFSALITAPQSVSPPASRAGTKPRTSAAKWRYASGQILTESPHAAGYAQAGMPSPLRERIVIVLPLIETRALELLARWRISARSAALVFFESRMRTRDGVSSVSEMMMRSVYFLLVVDTRRP